MPVLLMAGEVDADACAATLEAIGSVKKPFAADALLDADRRQTASGTSLRHYSTAFSILRPNAYKPSHAL
jgi:hypothetical protein